MGIKLGQVNIVVGDMDAMAGFYSRLGVPVDSGGMAQWEPHHRNTKRGEGPGIDLDSSEFAAVWNQGWPGGTGIVLGFYVDAREEVDRLYGDLTGAGHAGQQPPVDAFFGSRFAVVTDPDGNAVAIMSPPDDAFRSEGPEPPFS